MKVAHGVKHKSHSTETTDRAWFSCHLRHLTRKRVLLTEPTRCPSAEGRMNTYLKALFVSSTQLYRFSLQHLPKWETARWLTFPVWWSVKRKQGFGRRHWLFSYKRFLVTWRDRSDAISPPDCSLHHQNTNSTLIVILTITGFVTVTYRYS